MWARDPVSNRMFLWGGTLDGLNAEPGLWILDLTRGEEAWHELPLDGPPNRGSGGGLFDTARNRILFGFGNSLGSPYADLWALELRAP